MNDDDLVFFSNSREREATSRRRQNPRSIEADDEVVDSTDVFRKKKVLDRTFRDKMTKHTGVA
uniref:Uncharacterized protein n=1 Tax=Pristionchus pacificus TaxID=54126 RepID=A0A2A6CYQ9_PRIPA|eukprot:PDM83197.1 hypothetical protein PRIPAC_37590 [Pristionchus pacificus]